LRNVWFQIHWLIGITAGVVLAVIGTTGALLSFEPEILRSMNEGIITVSPQAGTPLLPAELLGRVGQASAGKQIASLTVFSDARNAARIVYAAEPPARRGESRYVNPYTGEILPRAKGEEFFRTVTQLHRYLLSAETGKQIVGASTVGLLFLAFSGIYLRWPARIFDWRAWLTFSWAQRGRAFLWSLHSVLGTWVLLCYLLAGFTGLYWSYNWYRDALFSVTGAPKPVQGGGAGGSERGAAAAVPGAVDEGQSREVTLAWQMFRRYVSAYDSATLRVPAKPGQPVQITYLDPRPPHPRATNRVVFDAGKLVEHERYQDKPAGSKIMSSMFSLHSGRFFGVPGAIAMMLASLLMPVSAVSGWLLYLGRRRRKKAQPQPASAGGGASHGS